MTAKETKINMFNAISMWKADKISQDELKKVIREHENQLCQEQREKCASIAYDMEGWEKLYDNVMNAPMLEI